LQISDFRLIADWRIRLFVYNLQSCNLKFNLKSEIWNLNSHDLG